MPCPDRRGPVGRRRSGQGRGARDAVRSEGGFVTAETALALPVMIAVLAVCVWVLAAAHAALRCQDAAAAAARALSRGESSAVVHDLLVRAAPPGASVRSRVEGDEVHVLVTASVPAAGLPLPPLEVSGRAVALLEPGAVAR